MENLENYISFDLEFNTVNEVAHIIQVSAVKFEKHKEVAQFDSYVHSDRPLMSFINGLTGITKEKIDTAPKKEEVLEKFKEFVGDFALIGYNAIKSDLPILLENGVDFSAQYKEDIFEIVKEKRSNELNGILNMKLTTVADYFNIQGHGHNSLEDARMTALIYEKLLELEENKQYLQQEETSNPAFQGLFDGVDLSKLFGE